MTPTNSLRVALILCCTMADGCVTLSGEQAVVSRTRLEPRCATAPVAKIDPTVRERVRLVVNSVETCSDREQLVLSEQRTRTLGTGPRWAIAIAASVLVLAAAEVGVAGITSPSDFWHPTPGARELDVGLTVGLGVLALAPAVGTLAGVYFLGKTEVSAPSQLETEVRVAPEVRKREEAAHGTLSWPGDPGAGHPLVQGALELSLEASAGLERGELALDGVRVEVAAGELERLSHLPSCRQALVVDPSLAGAPEAAQAAARWKKALACDGHGWGFADPVLDELRPRFANDRPLAH